MFKANLASYPYVSPIGSYSENLGRATRGFLAALLAIDPADINAKSSTASYPAEDPEAAAEELDELAQRFDPIMPNQAAELRYLLSRE